MLIHKATLGVLDYIWTGAYKTCPDGTRVPIERPAIPGDIPGYDASEWWEAPSSGPLAKKIRLYYPDLIPILDPDGELVGVSVHRDIPSPGLDAEQQIQEARSRGYKRRNQVRPRGLMPFLGVSEHTQKAGCRAVIEGLEPLKRKGNDL